MAGTTKEMTMIKQLLIRYLQGEKKRSISRSLGVSRKTVDRYIALAEADALSLEELVKLEDELLDFRFNGGSPAYTDVRYADFMERMPYFEREMGRAHMTLRLLWEEYIAEKPDGYSLTQFRYHYNQNAVARKGRSTTLLKDLHVGGDKLYLDFAGDKLSIVDRLTGEVIAVNVFVAVLPASDYAFVKAVFSQSTDDFCQAVDSCLQFLGGVPRQLVSDNLKAAVVKADRYCPTVNAVLEQLANHYGCVVNPARVRHPQDKALVENAVKLVYRRVYEPLRNRTFYDIDSLNAAIMEQVKAHNARRIQTADYSRQERFVAVDKPNLMPLPEERFELRRTTVLKVSNNSFVYLGCDKHYYSVPCQYIGRSVSVGFTARMVKIYYDGQCLATHPRERHTRYTYQKEHLPSQSQHYRGLSPAYYIERASKVSSAFKTVTETILASAAAPEVHYRSIDGLLALHRSTRNDIFEQACNTAIARGRCSYSYIKDLTKRLVANGTTHTQSFDMPQHGNIRGAKAYK